jgi:hypothetical protein
MGWEALERRAVFLSNCRSRAQRTRCSPDLLLFVRLRAIEKQKRDEASTDGPLQHLPATYVSSRSWALFFFSNRSWALLWPAQVRRQ